MRKCSWDVPSVYKSMLHCNTALGICQGILQKNTIECVYFYTIRKCCHRIFQVNLQKFCKFVLYSRIGIWAYLRQL